MKSSSFCYPYNSFFSLLQTIVEKKGYVVSSADIDKGRIKSNSEKSLFRKSKILDIKIFRLDEHTTGMTLMINANASVFVNPFDDDQYEEERMSNIINRFF